MKKNPIYSTVYFLLFILIILQISLTTVNSSIIISNSPAISFIKVPNKVIAGSVFNVRVGIISEIQIKFLKIKFDGVSKKVLPRRIDSNVYEFKITAVTPGKKILEIAAVNIKNIAGKSMHESLNVSKKEIFTGITSPGDTDKFNTPILRLDPPKFKISRFKYCCGDIAELRGKFFTDDIKVRIGSRRVKIERVTKTLLKVRFGYFSSNSYLYVKNKIGEAKSRYPVKVGCIPKILSFSPAEIGHKEILGINGKNLSDVTKVKLFVKYLGVDEIYNLNIIGAKHESVLNVKMPDILNYPGIAVLEMKSPCGSSNKVEITIKEDGVDYLKPKIKSFSPDTAAPGSTVIVYVSGLSVPKKDSVKVSFNNLTGIVKDLTFSKKKGYKLKVLIPEKIDNIVDYNQKVRVSSYKKITAGKGDFFLFGRPVIDSIKKSDWSDKYIKITGKNFKEKGTDVYFTGINGKWKISKEVFYMGFNKIQAKIPRNIKKGHIKVETLVNGITQFCISRTFFKPDTDK